MHTRAVARLLMLLCVFACNLGAVQLTDDANGFRVEIPEGLAKVRVDAARYPDTLHIYAEAERGGALLQFMQLPEELRQPQGNPPKDSSAPAEVPVLWRGHKLMRRHRYFASAQAVEISADVPVARRGIRIALTGPTRREIELVGMFSFVLEHFDARSNWTPSAAALPGPSAPAAPVEDAPQSTQSQPDATAAIAAVIALVLGFVGGWWLRGLGARPVAQTPTVELPRPEPPKSPTVVPAARPSVAAQKPPDETDPGNATPKCRVCGAEIRAGKKVCMNCGSEVF